MVQFNTSLGVHPIGVIVGIVDDEDIISFQLIEFTLHSEGVEGSPLSITSPVDISVNFGIYNEYIFPNTARE
jgi:hypothetical protein